MQILVSTVLKKEINKDSVIIRRNCSLAREQAKAPIRRDISLNKG